jgi:exodeoxyribonuclease V alpha subunit
MVGPARQRCTVVSRDPASNDTFGWQSGVLHLTSGAAHRFVSTGLRPMPAGAEVDLLLSPDPHPQYGDQVRVHECYAVRLPVTDEAIRILLAANVRGLGRARAARLVSVLGRGLFERLDANPEALTHIFQGKIGRDLVPAWTEWRSQWAVNQKATEIAARLHGSGVSAKMARRVIGYFRSAEAAEIVLGRRAHRLLDVPGFGWARADGIARGLGVSDDNPERLEAAVVHCLGEAAGEGHSCLPAASALSAVRKLVGTMRLADRAVAIALETAAVVEDGGDLYLPRPLECEWLVASRLQRHQAHPRKLPSDGAVAVEDIIGRSTLTLEQGSAVRLAFESGVLVLTGGPGTGKTTTVRTLIECCKALGLRTSIVTPTGKAAARATEVTGVRAGTVHRLVGAAPGNVRPGGPLDFDLLVIDEASMLSIEVFAWLLENTSPACRLFIVGDPHQLPSVDHGAVLRDMLAAPSVPRVALTIIQRQAADSGIVSNAYHLLRGERLQANRDDFILAAVPAAADPAGSLREQEAAASKLLRALARLARAGHDVRADVQVLTPMRRGKLGVYQLNVRIQDLLNRTGRPGPLIGNGNQVREGDRVMQVRNDYTLGETGVFNGEQGVVLSVGSDRAVVQFDENREIEVADYRLANLQLAWATTVHRSQGSEWKTVLSVFHRSHGRMLTRELLYTAVTRAKERVVLIGDERALEGIQSGSAGVAPPRHTGLARHIVLRSVGRSACPAGSMAGGLRAEGIPCIPQEGIMPQLGAS